MRHIPRNPCRIGIKSACAVWVRACSARKLMSQTKLCSAGPHALIKPDIQRDVCWLKAGSSNSGQGYVALLLSAGGCHFVSTRWSKVSFMVFKQISLIVKWRVNWCRSVGNVHLWLSAWCEKIWWFVFCSLQPAVYVATASAIHRNEWHAPDSTGCGPMPTMPSTPSELQCSSLDVFHFSDKIKAPSSSHLI